MVFDQDRFKEIANGINKMSISREERSVLKGIVATYLYDMAKPYFAEINSGELFSTQYKEFYQELEKECGQGFQVSFMIDDAFEIAMDNISFEGHTSFIKSNIVYNTLPQALTPPDIITRMVDLGNRIFRRYVAPVIKGYARGEYFFHLAEVIEYTYKANKDFSWSLWNSLRKLTLKEENKALCLSYIQDR